MPFLDPWRKWRVYSGDIERHIPSSGSSKCRGAGATTRFIGCHPAWDPDRRKSSCQQGGAQRSIGFGSGWRALRNVKTSDQSDPRGSCGCQRRSSAPQCPAGSIEKSGDIATNIDLNHALDPFDERARVGPASHRSSPFYRLASAVLRRSVINMDPGACVMQKSGRTSAITACGVTPHAQNTGSSSFPTGTASP